MRTKLRWRCRPLRLSKHCTNSHVTSFLWRASPNEKGYGFLARWVAKIATDRAENVRRGEDSSVLPLDTIRRAPKALLHDHLDGGLRPTTVVELAREAGYQELPTNDPDALAAWFTRGANRQSLELYLDGFRHTVALLQTRDAIER